MLLPKEWMGAEDGGEDDHLILTAGCFLQGVDFVLACIEKIQSINHLEYQNNETEQKTEHKFFYEKRIARHFRAVLRSRSRILVSALGPTFWQKQLLTCCFKTFFL